VSKFYNAYPGANMPLINSPSKTARNQNIKTEIAAGKPPKQAVAIGYAIQRRAKAKSKTKR
jgi:ABC-type glycerol-3-phosphate transport system substrate-binding protein